MEQMSMGDGDIERIVDGVVSRLEERLRDGLEDVSNPDKVRELASTAKILGPPTPQMSASDAEKEVGVIAMTDDEAMDGPGTVADLVQQIKELDAKIKELPKGRVDLFTKHLSRMADLNSMVLGVDLAKLEVSGFKEDVPKE